MACMDMGCFIPFSWTTFASNLHFLPLTTTPYLLHLWHEHTWLYFICFHIHTLPGKRTGQISYITQWNDNVHFGGILLFHHFPRVKSVMIDIKSDQSNKSRVVIGTCQSNLQLEPGSQQKRISLDKKSHSTPFMNYITCRFNVTLYHLWTILHVASSTLYALMCSWPLSLDGNL